MTDPNRDMYAELIDPQIALELLPKKIEERKRIITSLVLDIQVAQESAFGTGEECALLEKQLNANRDFLRIYEDRLKRVQEAVRGV